MRVWSWPTTGDGCSEERPGWVCGVDPTTDGRGMWPSFGTASGGRPRPKYRAAGGPVDNVVDKSVDGEPSTEGPADLSSA
jgi:hypothetical protein